MRSNSVGPENDYLNAPTIFAALLMSIFLALLTCGCTTVQTSDLPPDELQNQIASGWLIQKGDNVTVKTDTGQQYELEITQVSENSVRGEETFLKNEKVINENAEVSNQTVETRTVEIPIAAIVSIEQREITPVGAAGAAAGAVGLLYFLWILLPALLVGAIAGL